MGLTGCDYHRTVNFACVSCLISYLMDTTPDDIYVLERSFSELLDKRIEVAQVVHQGDECDVYFGPVESGVEPVPASSALLILQALVSVTATKYDRLIGLESRPNGRPRLVRV